MRVIAAWLALFQPRIIELLLITTVPPMVLAAGGWPGTGLVAATLAGGVLSAGGANAVNNVLDQDLDAVMERTRRRPVPSRRISARSAVVGGVLMGVGGSLVLWLAATALAALLAGAAFVFYVGVYTAWLKRTTPQNIVIGGAAGAAPALIGWAAVTGSLSLQAWLLFALVFFWTPPHFWALAIRFRDDYRRAGIPMFPSVAGVRATVAQILLYSVAVVGVSLLLAGVAQMGRVFLTAALMLGAGLVAAAASLLAAPDRAMRFFTLSNVYLALMFAVVALDVLV